MGAGHLELATRITLEGYQSAQAGIADRAQPVPLGVGTFQETRYGAFFLYDFHDATSGGNLFDASYVAKFEIANLSVYPILGFERRSARYVQHLYGITASESAASGLSSYSPRASLNPNAAIMAYYPLSPEWGVTYQLRKRWLDASITDSPLVTAKSQTSSFLAVTRTFD
jgi:outer membrane protein